MKMNDKILVIKTSIVDELKKIYQGEQSRHRLVLNSMNHLAAGIIAYSFLFKNTTANLYLTLKIQNNEN
ncbi:hypothetical protein [Chryseobacterium kwangjuense]|uniref:Transposase DDE domain-containing protein n=1 Tax=Chryseobacterium kwangjuense TaxID=267125 RepID=A0A135WF06_9FLAO|nr:hypothetical protein [Chryseobacterium kwangjuense]KXH83489.1 hypothetical protein AU378_13930 [Chryseobacterium kwangjuense]